jgi:RNA polymerase sigma-70 factor (sigma-E family)
VAEDGVEPSDGEAAFAAFVAARSAALLRTAWLLTGSEASAQDLVQTALMKTWSRWSSLRSHQALEAYVRQVMLSTFLSWRRRRWWFERPTDAAVPELADPDQAAVVELRVSVQAALRSLSNGQRAVLVLRYFEDLSEADTATLLGCSPGTVKSQTARAMTRLRDDARLGALWGEQV